jgi:DNA-binding GntR family transcriptional regulator
MFQRPLTAREAVLEELRRAILTGELAPGEAIRPDAMAARLGVSAVPVREALRTLQGEGQVTHRPHQGYAVTLLDWDELVKIYRIRELLETEALNQTVPMKDPTRLQSMEQAIDAMDRLGEDDIADLTMTNRAFHFALLQNTGSERLDQFIRTTWDWSDPYRALYYQQPGNLAHAQDEHREMLEGARRGDVTLLVELARRHRSAALEALKGRL